MKQIESILWGIIAATGALFLGILISTLIPVLLGPGKELPMDFSSPLNYILIISVLMEEVFKYIIIANRLEKFSYGRSLIINSMLMGLGFSLVELALIYGKFSANLNPSFELTEIAGLVLIHTLTAGIIGCFVAIRKAEKYMTFIKAIVIAFAIHFLYNALIIWENEFTDFLIFSFLSVTTAIIALNVININKKLAN